jgi:asparagine synthase (glutamine-hydrolysing)
LRLRGGQLKAVLREIARRRLGERVAHGKKRGFGVPVQRWIAGRWRGAVEESLRESILGREGWIHTEAVLEQLRSLRPAGCAPNQLWYLYVLENWLRTERSSVANEADRSDKLFAHLASGNDALDLVEGEKVAG